MGVAAALAREYAAEGSAFIPTLSRLLLDALPDCAEPVMAGGFLAKKTVAGVRVTLGDFQYTLDGSSKGPVKASRTHIVRGISLKSEPITVDEWLAEVGEGIDRRMHESNRIRTALGGLLGLG